MGTEFSWIQLSDLHIFDSTDWEQMIQHYENLSRVLSPNFMVVTGDYRHLKYKIGYEKSLKFLNKIINVFKIDKKDVYLVVGNHDVNNFRRRDELIAAITQVVPDNPDFYTQYMGNAEDDLLSAFREYSEFVREFYGNSINDDRISKPADIIVCKRSEITIIIINSALISNGNNSHKEIVDIKKLSTIRNVDHKPIIVLSHHPIESLFDSHQTRLLTCLRNLNASAFLCGDKHTLKINNLNIINNPNTTFPEIICGKSAIQPGDDYSDLSVIEYRANSDGNVYVQVYQYNTENGFIVSSKFYYNIIEKYRFPLLGYKKSVNNLSLQRTSSTSKIDNPNQISQEKQKSNNGTPISIWLPDAELANGKQTRFNSYTATNDLKEFFDPNSSYLGVSSVKGIGKTFILQVKRVKSSQKYQCLPFYSHPCTANNWATESVSFETYVQLQTKNNFDDLIALWMNTIKIYAINYMIKEVNRITLPQKAGLIAFEREMSNENYSYIYDLCVEEKRIKLNEIIHRILADKNWCNTLSKANLLLNNACTTLFSVRKKYKPSSKRIAIFIDKVDQSIMQTNAEPPADCVTCNYRNGFEKCNNQQKGTSFCYRNNNGCTNKECCYGCELFASENGNMSLRVYKNPISTKLIHINIWQYLQLALMCASTKIFEMFDGEISVFYTIRQEAFNCEEARLGEQNQKISSKTLMLKYTYKEQQTIFYECIAHQEDSFLFDCNSKTIQGRQDYAFVGINKLCHPYCLNSDSSHKTETLFECIYRHSFDRSRDIQRYGEYLTQNLDEFKACKNESEREETVKQKIEELAASLAYCDNQAESTVNVSYYTEKLKYLPNYWANNQNFEKLLSLIDRNLLFEDDCKKICQRINGLDCCPKEGCNSQKCNRHPFTMLYKMGYLGYLMHNSNNNKNDKQQFLDACEISYFVESDDLKSTERVAYIIHPALSKAIERKYNKQFKHFSGFILGKDLPVQSAVIIQMMLDKKTLLKEDFITKYYCEPKY